MYAAKKMKNIVLLIQDLFAVEVTPREKGRAGGRTECIKRKSYTLVKFERKLWITLD